MNHEGIGLGLTIVKKIVEASGGTIGVSSEGIGKGCVFYFSMKCRPSIEEIEEEKEDINDLR